MSVSLILEDWYTSVWVPSRPSLKCVYGSEIYSLGLAVDSWPELLDLIKSAVPYLGKTDFRVSYEDPEGDMVLITTTEALVEAYSLVQDVLKLWISKEAMPPELVWTAETDQVIDYNGIFSALSGVFTVCLDKKAVGMGVVVAGALAISASPVLLNIDTAGHAFALFSTPGFSCQFDPRRTYLQTGGVVVLAFKQKLSSDIHPLRIQSLVPRSGTPALTLHRAVSGNPKSSLKWVELKESSYDSFQYDSKEPCGPSGSPVLTPEFDLLGIQTTDSVLSNSAISGKALTQILEAMHQEVLELSEE